MTNNFDANQASQHTVGALSRQYVLQMITLTSEHFQDEITQKYPQLFLTL